MRVVELADDLEVAPEVLLSLLRTMRISVPGSDASMSDEDVSRILARLERERRSGDSDAAEAIQAVIEDAQPIAGKRRRRRASEIPPEPEPEEVSEEIAEDTAEEPEEEAFELVAVEVEEAPDGIAEVPESEEEVEAQPEEVAAVEAEAEAEDEDEVVEVEAAAEAEPEEPVEASAPAEAVDEVVTEAVEESPSAPSVPPPEPVRQSAPEGPARVIRRPKAAGAAGAPGQVRVQAEGYTPDGQRQQRAKKKGNKRARVDQSAVQENIQRVMAELKGGSKKRRRKGPALSKEEKETAEQEAAQEQERERTTVRVNEFLTVSELSELVDVSSTEIIGSAFKNLGLMVTINQRLDFDQIEMLLDEFDFTAVREEEYSGQEEMVVQEDAPEHSRPP